MSNIINLDDQRPHVVQEVVCIKCHKRWIACAPVDLLLKDYECPNKDIGFVIKAGQIME